MERLFKHSGHSLFDEDVQDALQTKLNLMLQFSDVRIVGENRHLEKAKPEIDSVILNLGLYT